MTSANASDLQKAHIMIRDNGYHVASMIGTTGIQHHFQPTIRHEASITIIGPNNGVPQGNYVIKLKPS